MRVLVTGAAGQLGEAIAGRFAKGHEVIRSTRAELDLRDGRALARYVRAASPDVIINCAAFNDVDGAEEDPVTPLEINALAVRALADVASLAGAVFVHYSTDFVFDGTGRRPYVEEDPPNPRGVYAVSKLLGEWFATGALRHYVLRVESLFGGARTRSSLDRIVDGITRGDEVRVFVDRTVSPSYVADVARATEELLAVEAPFGLYHCVNTGWATWHDVAREAARLLGRAARLQPVSAETVQLRARRPQYCALSNEKLARAGVRMPVWQDALARHVAARFQPETTDERRIENGMAGHREPKTKNA